MNETKTIKPSQKHFRQERFLFISQFIVFGVFCFLTYYNRIWNTTITLVFIVYLIWYLGYLINYKSKKIILSNDGLTYISFLRKVSFKTSEIANYKWHRPFYNWRINDYKGDTDYLSITEIIWDKLAGNVITPTKVSGKRKLRCFKSNELNIWLDEHVKKNGQSKTRLP